MTTYRHDNCIEYNFSVEHGFIHENTDYSSEHPIITFYNPTEQLPRNFYQSTLKYCPFCGKHLYHPIVKS